MQASEKVCYRVARPIPLFDCKPGDVLVVFASIGVLTVVRRHGRTRRPRVVGRYRVGPMLCAGLAYAHALRVLPSAGVCPKAPEARPSVRTALRVLADRTIAGAPEPNGVDLTSRAILRPQWSGLR